MKLEKTESGQLFRVPEQEDYDKLAEWQEAVASLEKVKELSQRESELRKEIAELFFPSPEEGVNKMSLQGGWELKVTHKIDRKIDVDTLPIISGQLVEKGVSVDSLIQTKVSVDMKAYKALCQINPDAAKIFEKTLISKPASPTLVLVAPKKGK